MRRAALLLSLLCATPAAAQDCDQRLVLGNILTGTGERAQAALIEEGRFAFVGRADAVPEEVEAECRIVLPEGAVAMPGLTDGHAHLLGIGLREMTLNLEGTASIEELQARLAEAAGDKPRGTITGRGWIETGWPEGRMPTREDLDAVVANRPVILTRADGHAAVVNSAALWMAGIDADTADPEGGRIVRDESGAATGLLIDNAEALVADLRPALDEARRREALERGARLYAERGWTGLHNMSVDAEDLPILEDLARRGRLPLRVASYVVPEALAGLEGPRCDETGRACTAGVKLYVDGALGSRGAALFAPYADEAATSGLLLISEEEAKAYYAQAQEKGLGVTTHAIGDRGNALVLDWYADAMPEGGRWRIEHAQIVRPEDIPRFSRLGVIASMQPSHAIGDLHFASDRLGDDRLDGAYAWASLLATGAVVVGGSDAPVEQGDPRIELYAATQRRDLEGFQGPGWRGREALSEQAALRIFTRSPAYALGQEEERGQVAEGMAADLSVFGGDPFAGPEAAEPLFTLIGGELAAGELPE
ncbi:amidohydrolase [Parvularcula oceani]|uniref:amidohydrolase n=1 Tax=Parvularcula oceani TaxID=1247963 RepID=UPI0004E0DEF9|nr:amidohydrolase [Parvularcula oceani]